MAKAVMFNGKLVRLPGTYAKVISGIKNETPLSTYGNVLLIDAGVGTGFNSIKGIEGKGKEAIYSLDKDQANFYVKGGPLAPFVDALFTPNTGISGISSLKLVKAATTTPASASTWSIFGGAITATKIETIEEGTICNTTLVSSVLKKGYQIKALYDTASAKGYIEVWMGTYEGTTVNGYTVGETEAISTPTVVYRSKKCSSAKLLYNELLKSSDFNSLFKVSGLTLVADTFTATTTTETSLTGGTDSYLTNLSSIWEFLKDVDYTFIMVLGAEGAQTFNSVALDHILNDAKGVKIFCSYAGAFDDAVDMAEGLNTDSAIVFSGIVKKTSKSSPDGYIVHDDFVTAGYCLGRIAGLSPEIPATMKSLGIDGMETEPSDGKLEDLLDAGVITPYFDVDLGYYCLSQAVTSLQNDDFFINDDCTTYSLQVKRIISSVIKNIQLQSKVEFYGGTTPTNKGSLSDAYLKEWTKGKLERMTFSQDKVEANYLLSYDVTKIETIEDSKYVYFNFTVNGEVNKIFFIGTILG